MYGATINSYVKLSSNTSAMESVVKFVRKSKSNLSDIEVFAVPVEVKLTKKPIIAGLPQGQM